MNDCKNELLSTLKNIGIWAVSAYDKMRTFVTSETFLEFLEFISNIPDDIKETELYKSIMNLKDSQITFETIKWFQNEIGYMSFDSSKNTINNKKGKSNLDKYVISIIDSESLYFREKLVVLLVHFEAIVYQTLVCDRVAKKSLKRVLSDSYEKLSDMDYKTLIILGIVFIVFSDTDRADLYKNGIDRRIPFRNNILHRGTIDYSDDEVRAAYELLIYFIAQLASISEM